MDKDKSISILTRLQQADKILTNALKTKPKEVLKDGFAIGASQINMLRSWSTDKDDRNPLIRTMSYSSSAFPYLAKNNDELKKMPRALMAKARDKHGNLTDLNLHDARNKSKVRVSRKALKWWLENGRTCSDQVLKTVKFINSVGIRKIHEFNLIDFGAVTTGRKALTRRRVQTETPVINILGKRGQFFSGVFEGNLDSLGLSESDKANIRTLNTEILELIQDPDDIVRIVSSLTNRKVKYIPVNELFNTSLIEMRHAIESDKWQVLVNGVPRDRNKENNIIKVTCGLMIYYALFAGMAAKKTLIEMLERTFLGNESIALILKEMETTPNMLTAVCQAALGKPIPQFKQFMGVTFIRTEFTRYLAGLSKETKIRISEDANEVRGRKLVNYMIKVVEPYRSHLTPEIKAFYFAKGLSEYHVRYSSSSAELKVIDDKLDHVTFQTRSRSDFIHMMSAIIVQLSLWDDNTVFPGLEFRQNEKIDIKGRLFDYFKDPLTWPFQRIVERRMKIPHEIQMDRVPAFKQVVVCDMEATSYGDTDLDCLVHDTTLQVSAKEKFGYGENESYERIFIYADSIKSSADIVAKSYKTFPAEIFSVHPVLVTRLGTDQRVMMFFIECFNIFAKYPNHRVAIYKINEDSVKILEHQFQIDLRDFNHLNHFLDYIEKYLFEGDYRSNFSYVIAKVLVTNFYQVRPSRMSALSLNRTANEEIRITHPLFSLVLPNLDVGSASVNYEHVFKVKTEALFNLRTKQMLIGANYFEYPNLKRCTETIEHIQLKGIPVSALKGEVGKHVLLMGQCYIVESIVGKQPIQEILENIQLKQTTIQQQEWADIQSDTESELSESDIVDVEMDYL